MKTVANYIYMIRASMNNERLSPNCVNVVANYMNKNPKAEGHLIFFKMAKEGIHHVILVDNNDNVVADSLAYKMKSLEDYKKEKYKIADKISLDKIKKDYFRENNSKQILREILLESDRKLSPQLFSKDLYAKAKDGDIFDKIKYMEHLFTKANNLLFHNQLNDTTIQFKVKKTTQANKLNVRGTYHYINGQSTINMSSRIFNSEEEEFVKIFLHEMCHYAVIDITKDRKAGHGPTWKKWMVKIGLSPDRLDVNDNTVYMTADEKEKHHVGLQMKSQAIEKEIPIDFHKIWKGTGAKFYSIKQNKWIYGYLVRARTSKIVFVSAEQIRAWWNLLPTNIFKINSQEQQALDAKGKDFWQNKIDFINDYFDKAQDRRNKIKALKKYGFNFDR